MNRMLCWRQDTQQNDILKNNSSIATLSIATLSIATLSIETLSITTLDAVLRCCLPPGCTYKFKIRMEVTDNANTLAYCGTKIVMAIRQYMSLEGYK
jgi:hypothetical protein